MTFPSRRKPLALLLYVAGSVAASFVGQSQAQTAVAFRIDPVLLGLPPATPVSPMPPAPATEVRPVGRPAVETRLLPSTSGANAEPSPALAGVVPPSPVAAPAEVTSPLPVTPADGAEIAPAGEVRPLQAPIIAAPPATAPVESEARNTSPASAVLSVLSPVETRLLPPAVREAAKQVDLPAPDARTTPPLPAKTATPAETATTDETDAPAETISPLPTSRQDAVASDLHQTVEPPAAASTPDETVTLPVLAVTEVEIRPLSPAPTAAPSPAAGTGKETGVPGSLRVARVMVPPPMKSDVPRPAFLRAQRISGVVDHEVLAEDDAELRKIGTVLTGERLTYWPADDEVEALGNARLEQGGNFITGPKMRLKIEDHVGFVEDASYFLSKKARQSGITPATDAPGHAPESSGLASEGTGATIGFAEPRRTNITPGQTQAKAKGPASVVTEGRGESERIDLEGENQYRLASATYTTCKPGNNDWYLSVGELKLDYDNGVGSGDSTTVHFLGVPILHSPWVSFPLSDARKSGFLLPSYGTGSDNGFEFTLPYYWNIAPNMDATISPRIFSKRGFQLGTDCRYLNSALWGTYSGEALLEVLPHDRETNTDRYRVTLVHNQIFANGFSGTVNYSRLSDNTYYTDLSSQIVNTAKTQLLEQGTLTYGGGGWWNATANFQSYQTLQPDPQNPVAQPYRMLPQITVNARQPDLYFADSAFFGQYTNFVSAGATKVAGLVVIPSQVEGQRTVLQPQLSVPYVAPGWYVIPRIGANVTQYSLSYPSAFNILPDSLNRSLPIFSVDTGMAFERPNNWFGRDYTQTLEPRLFYLNIPYKNQNDIPIFDTALADFNFAQIFADNRYSGWDRINNANQLTAALSSRLIDSSNGSEIMRAMFGQVFYFTRNKVLLPGPVINPSTDWATSNYLAAFSGQVWPRVFTDIALEYDPTDRQFQRIGVGTHYVPAAGKLINASYSYNPAAATPIKQVDISGQWPISGRWQAVGRYNYSFLQNVPVEVIGGLEYNAGCWALRAVAHRIQTTQSDSTTQFLLQLELSGLSSLGSNPLSLIQRSITGYAVGQPVIDPALAEK